MLVYLDQSDWAVLHAGGAPEVEVTLRQFGATGAATYLVSAEHFMESQALGPGCRERLAFLRGFPGTAAILIGTDVLLEREATRLVADARGEGHAPLDIGAVRLSRLDDAQFEQIVQLGPGVLRSFHRLTVVAESLGRRARGSQTKAIRLQTAAAEKALLAGDAVAFERAIGALGPPVGPVRRYLFQKLVPVAGRAAAWARGRGFVGPPRHHDRMFDICVLPRLGADVRHDQSLMQQLARTWANERSRSKIVPSIAAYASVRAALENDLRRRVEVGDLVDARHAAFAPLVDVFCCDKRNEAPIRRALGEGAATTVLRCNRLEDVTKVIAASRPEA